MYSCALDALFRSVCCGWAVQQVRQNSAHACCFLIRELLHLCLDVIPVHLLEAGTKRKVSASEALGDGGNDDDVNADDEAAATCQYEGGERCLDSLRIYLGAHPQHPQLD